MFNSFAQKSGSVIRASKRNGIVTALTRAQAQRMVAGTTDGTEIAAFLAHPNSHVAKYAAHKLLNNLGPCLASLSTPTVTEPDFSAFAVKAWTADQAAEVLAIMAARGMTADQAAERIGCKARRITDWAKKLAAKG
jgi:hypothetical protein